MLPFLPFIRSSLQGLSDRALKIFCVAMAAIGIASLCIEGWIVWKILHV
jgi:hypothetical protein